MGKWRDIFYCKTSQFLIIGFIALLILRFEAYGQGVPKQGFPTGNYTPFGYLDNPYHTLWLNNSGVIRSAPPLGFRFREHKTIMQLAVEVNGHSYSSTADLETANLHSSYHSKNIFTYNWTIEKINFTTTYFLESDQANGLNCEVKIENSGLSTAIVEVRATLSVPPLDFDHYTAMIMADNGVILRRFAEGPVYLLDTEAKDVFRAVSSSSESVIKYMANGDREGLGTSAVSVRGDYMGGVLGFQTSISSRDVKAFRFCLLRDITQAAAVNKSRLALKNFDARLKALVEDDRNFWQGCPRLTGDWPELWKRGFVYDWETLRMTIRRPIGIYKHYWDGMQVTIPRSVLAETAIDMFTYSYADPDMAKQVIYGLFADAIAPNIPCVREDGSVNMVSESGSECGTAPSWCLPSLAIQSIYARTEDQRWATNLYPYLEKFIDWWFANRTHDDSTFFFDNSWESGQDQSTRFLIEHKTGGTGVQFIEPVDLHASIADFAYLLSSLADILKQKNKKKWLYLFEKHKKLINKYWVKGEFHDIDRRTGKHTNSHSSYLLVPFVFNLTNDDQNDSLRQHFKKSFYGELSDWVRWSPSFQVVIETMWAAGERALQSEHISNQLDYVYSWWDRRTWEAPAILPRVWGHVERPANLLEYHPRTWEKTVGMIDQSTNPRAAPHQYAVPMPGVACESWKGRKGHPGGMENYGWGAAMPMHLIRGIIGYRDLPPDANLGFLLAPSLPSKVLKFGNQLGMANLHYRDVNFDVTYVVQEKNQIHTTLSWHATAPLHVMARTNNKIVAESRGKQADGTLNYTIKNYGISEIIFE